MANNKVKFIRGTTEEYQALSVKDPDVLYIITDESENSDIINDTLISQTTTWSSQKIHDSLNDVVDEAKTYADGLAENTAAKNHTHTVSEITDFPTSLPANGGNADTVGGVSVSSSDEVGLRKISTGTEDLTAGTSALETGTIYLVYE